MAGPASYAALAEAAWGWVLDHVEWDAAGPWIPFSVDVDGSGPAVPLADDERYGMHSGVPGLAHTLAEIRLDRAWTDEEQRLADGIIGLVRAHPPLTSDIGFFDGLASDVGVLVALGQGGLGPVLDRMLESAGPLGWPTPFVNPTLLPGATYTDASIGTASAVLAGLWASRHGEPQGDAVVDRAVEVLLATVEETGDGVTWPFVPPGLRAADAGPAAEMPNWSHGVAGIAASLALAGAHRDRPDLLELARRGAEHLVAVADTGGGGFAAARIRPWEPRHGDEYTWNWCQGAPGTARAFLALAVAGIPSVAGVASLTWHDRALESTVASGIPARLHPGFWDNDGRCCGSAGVADIALDAWQRTGRGDWLDLADRLADAVADHAVHSGRYAYWRYVEHTLPDPLLPPSVGWMQGAAGIVALLLRLARVLRDGREAPAVARMEQWWCLPPD